MSKRISQIPQTSSTKLFRVSLPIVVLIILINATPILSQGEMQISLGEAIRIALQDNLELKQSFNQIFSNELTVNQSKAEFLPDLSASISSTQKYGKELDPISGSNESQTTETVNASLSSSINLFNGFGDIASLKKAKYEYDAALKTYDHQQQSIIYNTISGFIQVVLKEELVMIEEENLTSQGLLLNRIEAFYASGNIPISDVLQQRADISQAELRLLDAQRSYHLSKLQLLTTLGKEATEDVNFTVPDLDAIIVQISETESNKSLDSILLKRADLAVQLILSLAIEKEIQAAKSGLLPSASLFTNYGTNYMSSTVSSNFSAQFIDENPTLTIGLNFSIPLFDRSITKSNVEQGKLRQSNQQLETELLRLNIKSEIEQSLVNYNIALKQSEVAQAQLDFATQALEASQARYEVGSSTFTELSQVRTQALEAANNRVQADWGLLAAHVTVKYYCGEVASTIGLFN